MFLGQSSLLKIRIEFFFSYINFSSKLEKNVYFYQCLSFTFFFFHFSKLYNLSTIKLFSRFCFQLNLALFNLGDWVEKQANRSNKKIFFSNKLHFNICAGGGDFCIFIQVKLVVPSKNYFHFSELFQRKNFFFKVFNVCFNYLCRETII